MNVDRVRTIAIAFLRCGFLLSLAFVLWNQVRNAEWVSSLNISPTTYLIDLESAPVWAPPETPYYERFQADFPDLPKSLPSDARIVRCLDAERILFGVQLRVWPIALFFGGLYFLFRPRKPDVVLLAAAFVGVGLTVGAFGSVALWLALGGWGPVAPVTFGVIGTTLGVVAALAQWTFGASPWNERS